jgi:hypothetical protein
MSVHNNYDLLSLRSVIPINPSHDYIDIRRSLLIRLVIIQTSICSSRLCNGCNGEA